MVDLTVTVIGLCVAVFGIGWLLYVLVVTVYDDVQAWKNREQ